MPEVPNPVVMTLQCLEPGCNRGKFSSYVGQQLTDEQREQSAEGFCQHSARWCRLNHEAGVEARFSDDPRRIVLSRPRRVLGFLWRRPGRIWRR